MSAKNEKMSLKHKALIEELTLGTLQFTVDSSIFFSK